MTNKKLIIANWKMNPESLTETDGILEFVNDYFKSLPEHNESAVVFCPPFIFLEEVSRVIKTSHLGHDAFLGAQDIAAEDKTATRERRERSSRRMTALTGEVSGPMLTGLGVRYVIIGHSERRWKLGETDEIVNRKLGSALRNGLIPIVCIGERTRDSDFEIFLKNQIESTFKELTSDDINKCIIAYEPVWAISTNPEARPDTPESALESIGIIKKNLSSLFNIQNLPVLYGGSINSDNAGDFLSQNGIDGVLVGSASIKKEEFVKILKIASKI